MKDRFKKKKSLDKLSQIRENCVCKLSCFFGGGFLLKANWKVQVSKRVKSMINECILWIGNTSKY